MNEYFICNRNNFPVVLEWADQQIMDGNVQLIASCEAQSPQIMKNADGPHEWDVPYHFARTAACVMRLGMLMATGLDEPRYCRLNFGSVHENRRAFRITGEQERINEGQFLAADREETCLLYLSFDLMYAYDCIEPLLHDQPQGEQQQSMQCRMIVFNPVHNVIWKITATLDIVSDRERVLEARPFIAVWRYDPVPDRENFPLLDDDIQNNVPIEEVVKDARGMCLGDFLR